VLWNRALRDIVQADVPDIGDSARLLALADLAMGDAGITAWDSKFIRLLAAAHAIQNGDNDGNPETAGDPTWQPMINTPNYPDYTSGANNVTGAITRILALFFGTDKKDLHGNHHERCSHSADATPITASRCSRGCG